MNGVGSRSAGPWRARAVSFDCWSTLIVERDWPAAHRIRVEALRDAAREAGRELTTARAGAVFDAAWGRHMTLWSDGRSTGAREIATWALEAVGVQRADVHAHLVDHFEEASHSGRVEALPGARETLVALRSAGIRRALVCDTGLTPGRVVRRHLDRLGLLVELESLAFSDEVGVPKPDPRIFRAALDPLGVTPDACVHVGDLRSHDVAGARALGAHSVRIRGCHDDVGDGPEADVVVDDHAQLRDLLLPPGRRG